AVWRRLPVVAAAASAHPRSGTRAIGGFTWDLVAEAPARFFDSYTALVPSHSDSTAADPAWEHFMVTARTAVPTVFYNSAVDSGYSVDNLAPGTPQGLLGAGEWNPEGLRLTWDPGPESDLAHYAVYRGQDPAFVPSPGNLLASPSDPTYFDSAWNWNSKYTYKVSALDVHDNESGFAASGPDDVTDIGDDATPHVNFLSQNAPNPFNPLTRIAYSLAGRGEVSLRVYDAAGRMVRELVAGVRGPGRYEETWDGRDYRGSRVASGVYFYRLEAGDFTSTRKMALLK
ncbi:MAG: T9SS type A sorting domain-containing protein, partial [Candidatus Krumholzibacteria bacterium]|nr:T9SS type A sorting domain-containing protein [Candidatus Krumholzibacteria bacterium]